MTNNPYENLSGKQIALLDDPVIAKLFQSIANNALRNVINNLDILPVDIYDDLIVGDLAGLLKRYPVDGFIAHPDHLDTLNQILIASEFTPTVILMPKDTRQEFYVPIREKGIPTVEKNPLDFNCTCERCLQEMNKLLMKNSL